MSAIYEVIYHIFQYFTFQTNVYIINYLVRLKSGPTDVFRIMIIIYDVYHQMSKYLYCPSIHSVRVFILSKYSYLLRVLFQSATCFSYVPISSKRGVCWDPTTQVSLIPSRGSSSQTSAKLRRYSKASE